MCTDEFFSCIKNVLDQFKSENIDNVYEGVLMFELEAIISALFTLYRIK
jgi:hypothetical protein